MKQIKLIVIGVGPHSKRVYLPILQRLKERYKVDVAVVVDISRKETDVRCYLESVGMKPRMLFVEPFAEHMPLSVEEALNDAVRSERIAGAIIATEPLAHRVYAEWALSQGLHILMDKPISARKNVVSDPLQAAGIYDDYLKLLRAYRRLQHDKETIFSINVQRRYHAGIRKVIDLLEEIARQTNCPVTSIQSMHCDGQWRLPSEIVTQLYHPYSQGYGKVSHSGYHIIDAMYCFYNTAAVTDKKASAAEVYSSFVQPAGFLEQITEADYERYFGPAYGGVCLFSDADLSSIYRGYGEMDAFSIIRFLRNGENTCNASINLLHNSFARRHWLQPGTDLYKGNGRVKHEYHNIQQGPFQNIQIHSFQSKDRHEINTADDYSVGGNNHFDIYVYRNCDMTGDSEPMHRICMDELAQSHGYSDRRLVSEEAKIAVVREFLQFIRGELDKHELRSSIEDHAVPTQIMSAIYLSHIMQRNGANPVIRADFTAPELTEGRVSLNTQPHTMESASRTM